MDNIISDGANRILKNTNKHVRPTKVPPLHKESLLHIPLVAHMFEDTDFRFIKRGVDARWFYSGVLAGRIEGFNPMCNAVMVGRHSFIDKWLGNEEKSARRYNCDDKLMHEVMFAVHDYLHAWSYRWISEVCPEIGFGTAEITKDNFELMVFCHLLTEAVATVGLDYWYLSCVDINKVVPIGTATRGLTINYRESFTSEHQRFSPDLKVQSPEFLTTLTQFYCDGIFHGFAANDLKRSPVTHNWLRHELEYGKKQRAYSRQWVSYLGGLNTVEYEQVVRGLSKPIKHDGRKQKKLMHELGLLLWAKVKYEDPKLPGVTLANSERWKRPNKAGYEYQFTNLNRSRFPSKQNQALMSNESFSYLLRQYIARFDYERFPAEVRDIFPAIKEQRSLALGKRLLSGFDRISVSRHEPRDIFLFG